MTRPPASLVSQIGGVYTGMMRIGAAIARDAPGTRLTSWYRNPATNAAVGGARLSQHQLALAIDLGGDLDQIEVAARRHWPGVVVRERDHVHLQVFPAGKLPAELFRSLGVPV